MKRFGITYPVITDDGPLIGHYGVTGYPETFFIDRRGRVIPLPPNTTARSGTSSVRRRRELLDLGIRHALEAVRRAARSRSPPSSRSWRSSSASRSCSARTASTHPTQASSRPSSSAPTCHEPLDESNSPLAQQMKEYIRRKIAAGLDEERRSSD